MAKQTMWYSVEDAGDERFSVDTVFAPHEPRECFGEMVTWDGCDQEAAATDAAEDYYNSHDGWESRWPLVFTLYASEDGPALAKVTVEQESEPVFYGRVVKPR